MNNITNVSLEAPSTPWDDYVVPNYTAFTTLVLCAVILGRLAFCVPFFFGGGGEVEPTDNEARDD